MFYHTCTCTATASGPTDAGGPNTDLIVGLTVGLVGPAAIIIAAIITTYKCKSKYAFSAVCFNRNYVAKMTFGNMPHLC